MEASTKAHQVNVRVPEEDYDVLAAAAFVRDLRGMQDLVYPVLLELVTALKAEEAVQEAVAARVRHRGRRRKVPG